MFSTLQFKRECVIALHLEGKSPTAIINELEYLKLNKMFVSRTISRYNETGSIAKRYGGGPKKRATGPGMVEKVKEKIESHSLHSAREIAKELHVSEWSIRRILKNVLYKNDKMVDESNNENGHDWNMSTLTEDKTATATSEQTAATDSITMPMNSVATVKYVPSNEFERNQICHMADTTNECQIFNLAEFNIEEISNDSLYEADLIENFMLHKEPSISDINIIADYIDDDNSM